MNTKRAFTAIAAIILLLIGLAVYLLNVQPPRIPPSPTSKLARIKVGVIVSEFTATGPHWLAKPYGFASVQRIVRELRDPSLELIPLIEPGTQDQPDLNAELHKD